MRHFLSNTLFPSILLLVIMCLTFLIRIQGVERIPEGQFTENDAYTFHWQASIIAKHGYLPALDEHRWLPYGRDNQKFLSFYAYTIAYIHKVFPWLSLYHIQFYFSTVCFTLGVGILFIFLARTYGLFLASIVGLLLATLPGSISRSAAGFGDRDALCWFLGLLAVTFYIL